MHGRGQTSLHRYFFLSSAEGLRACRGQRQKTKAHCGRDAGKSQRIMLRTPRVRAATGCPKVPNTSFPGTVEQAQQWHNYEPEIHISRAPDAGKLANLNKAGR
jgi:hypothetical protein